MTYFYLHYKKERVVFLEKGGSILYNKCMFRVFMLIQFYMLDHLTKKVVFLQKRIVLFPDDIFEYFKFFFCFIETGVSLSIYTINF